MNGVCGVLGAAPEAMRSWGDGRQSSLFAAARRYRSPDLAGSSGRVPEATLPDATRSIQSVRPKRYSMKQALSHAVRRCYFRLPIEFELGRRQIEATRWLQVQSM